MAGNKETKDKKIIQKLAGIKSVEWKKHALKRLLERDISRQSVLEEWEAGFKIRRKK